MCAKRVHAVTARLASSYGIIDAKRCADAIVRRHSSSNDMMCIWVLVREVLLKLEALRTQDSECTRANAL